MTQTLGSPPQRQNDQGPKHAGHFVPEALTLQDRCTLMRESSTSLRIPEPSLTASAVDAPRQESEATRVKEGGADRPLAARRGAPWSVVLVSV